MLALKVLLLPCWSSAGAAMAVGWPVGWVQVRVGSRFAAGPGIDGGPVPVGD